MFHASLKCMYSESRPFGSVANEALTDFRNDRLHAARRRAVDDLHHLPHVLRYIQF